MAEADVAQARERERALPEEINSLTKTIEQIRQENIEKLRWSVSATQELESDAAANAKVERYRSRQEQEAATAQRNCRRGRLASRRRDRARSARDAQQH